MAPRLAWLLIPIILLWLAWAGAARADIYAFTDDAGVPHFSNMPVDQRYTLLMRTETDAPSVAAKARSARGGINGSLYAPEISRAASFSQLELALLHAVIAAESGYNPRALSGKGAIGLMQLMPGTARRYGAVDPYDPAQNIRAGALYLRDLLAMFNNDMRLALAAYNAGENNVIKYGNRIPPFRETAAYVPRVMAFYQEYRRAYPGSS
ncbi:lytic transglycosylase catalytic [Sulfuricella denitrificans skB26]|uniref:Lytic transglycosylase catalytic n=1 Tax=Sulfuricella denitrificans (strain DSM 22764 / NBRC 105220 / skB26) TaxID=1163617 RepID=S6ABA5_SULDS|nr:lytic transglycosylase domain-containing protein [Sulfuricella denitrificans]BAN36620.1 lytic transglycosylase catalytic [Sulfuricella denitrificans skB26]